MRWQTPQGTVELNLTESSGTPVTINVIQLINDATEHFNADRLQEAGAILQTVLKYHPEQQDALHILGVIYHKKNLNGVAINYLEKAVNLNPRDPQLLNNTGEVYRALGRLDMALKCYQNALKINRDFAVAHNNLANVYSAMGDNDKAASHYENAIGLKKNYTEAYRNLTIIKTPEPDDQYANDMLALLDNPEISTNDAMHLHFAMGKIYQTANDYDNAFKHFNEGNLLKRKTINFDISERRNYIDKLIQIFTKKYFKQFSSYGNDSRRPVFIVGMPRSGTTLVEQIISSHPEIYGADELSFFSLVEQTLTNRLNVNEPYPECMQALTSPVADKVSSEYLDHLESYSKDATHVTDKMPGNFQRIGLIKTFFPDAKIIHCRRNPLDTCVSIYCNFFVQTHNYAYDLQELGQFYLEYERLMVHWRKLFGEEIYEVQYETLTQEQEKISRELLEYIGVPWDECCLEFYNNKRPVQTASNTQVKKPMYSDSVNRWKHYEKYLGPLQEVLNTKN